MEENNYLLRAARDTLVSQLGLAAPTPLADLPVRAIEYVVVHGNQAQLEIAYSQPDVSYKLCNAEGRIMRTAQGTGGPLRLKTADLEDDEYAFSIRAVRTPESDPHLPGPLEVKLLQTVVVQVRTDTTLATSLQAPSIAFGAQAEVWVHSAQSKTRYELVDEAEKPLGEAVETRTAGDVSLRTRALTEDTTIVVRATNIKKGLSDLLTQRVHVAVGPKLDVAAAFTPSVVDYNSEATIHLAKSQERTSYQLVVEETGRKAQPQESPAVAGTGGDIELTIKELREDCTVGIKATKVASGLADTLAAQLTIPVRPDPAKTLSLVAALTEAGKSTVVASVAAGAKAIIKVASSQPGVCYQLRADTSPVGPPAYHHVNAGIGRARVGVEFAIDTFTGDAVYLPTGILTKTTEFTVFAFKPTRKAEGVVVGTIKVPVEAAGS